jgi:hypothetical protein
MLRLAGFDLRLDTRRRRLWRTRLRGRVTQRNNLNSFEIPVEDCVDLLLDYEIY